MNKRLLISVSAIVFGVSSSLAMAEPCAPNTQCQNNGPAQNQQMQQHSKQSQPQSQSKQQVQHQPQQQNQNNMGQAKGHGQNQNAQNQGHNNQSNNQGNGQAHGQGKHDVRVDSARLRSGPRTGYQVVQGLRKGAQVEVIKVQDDWAQVQIGTTLLWVAASLLTSN